MYYFPQNYDENFSKLRPAYHLNEFYALNVFKYDQSLNCIDFDIHDILRSIKFLNFTLKLLIIHVNHCENHLYKDRNERISFKKAMEL